PYCEVGAGRILVIGIAIAGHDGALHVEMTRWREENLRPRRTCRIERLEYGTEQIAERIAEGLDKPGTAVFLIAIEIQTGQLSGSDSHLIVQKELLHPEGIQTRSVLTHQIARVSESPDFATQAGSRLPQPRGVKAESLPLDHPVEIDVYRSSNSFPSGIGLLYSAAGISLHVRDVEK